MAARSSAPASLLLDSPPSLPEADMVDIGEDNVLKIVIVKCAVMSVECAYAYAYRQKARARRKERKSEVAICYMCVQLA